MEFISNLSPEMLIGAIVAGAFVIGIIISLLFGKSSSSSETDGQGTEPESTGSPYKEYGKMDTTRAKEEFDMDDEEIAMFMDELKAQIEEEIPAIEKQINENDLVNLKSSIHKIKGSAVNLGEGGIASLLFDFNHYLSEGKDNKDEIKKMFEDILYYKERM